MIAVKQNREHDPPHTYGDCLLACIASILEIPLDEVDYDIIDNDQVHWYAKLVSFLKEQGYLPTTVNPNAVHKHKRHHLIAVGKSPRFDNYDHAVIYKNQNLVHDPHPSNDGIDDEPTYYIDIKEYEP